MDIVSEALSQREAAPPPPRLYHYTDATGALGILSAGQVWFTHFEYLNDRLEGHYFVEVLRRWLARPGEGAERAVWARLVVAQGLSLLRSFGTPYVFSLSEDRDSLSQWRGYGGDGAGYAVGFDGQALKSILRPKSRPPTFARVDTVKVVYDEDEQHRLLTRFAERWPSDGDRLHDVATAALAELVFAPSFKHPAFREEREWRVVLAGQGVEMARTQPNVAEEQRGWAAAMQNWLHFRPSPRRGLVPYLAVGSELLPLRHLIREVRLGPRIPRDEGERALELLLATRPEELGTVTMTYSSAPYR